MWFSTTTEATFEFRRKDRFNLKLDPEKAKEFHDETIPAEGAKLARFRSMKITRDVHEFAKEQNIEEEKALAVEMAEKAKEFMATGGEIYHGNLPEGARRASLTF